MNKRMFFAGGWYVALLWLCGCGTIPERYIPCISGAFDPGGPVNGLEMTIMARDDQVHIGEVVEFDLTLRNVSPSPMWVPRQPAAMFFWTHANGDRDNQVFEVEAEHFYTSQDALQLKPGQPHTRRVVIRTYYFPAVGLTEFKAVLKVPRNTNPQLVPFWEGELVSNAYGVTMLKRSR